jgi:archaetidylinositol phosphate synthase
MKARTNWSEIRGDKRIRDYILDKPEKRLINFLAPRIPPFIETYHLTLTAIPLGLLLVGLGYLTQQNRLWFLASALIVFLRYLADALDGEIGRRRNTGLVRWGFYVDHFLDFMFSICLLSSYIFYLPQNKLVLLLILGTIAAHFLNASLVCIALGQYRTTGRFRIGPTEIILLTIIFDLYLAFFPPTFTKPILMFFWFITTTGVILEFYRVQKILWDKELKKK